MHKNVPNISGGDKVKSWDASLQTIIPARVFHINVEERKKYTRIENTKRRKKKQMILTIVILSIREPSALLSSLYNHG